MDSRALQKRRPPAEHQVRKVSRRVSERGTPIDDSGQPARARVDDDVSRREVGVDDSRPAAMIARQGRPRN
jgi:hypothetical protein